MVQISITYSTATVCSIQINQEDTSSAYIVTVLQTVIRQLCQKSQVRKKTYRIQRDTILRYKKGNTLIAVVIPKLKIRRYCFDVICG